MTTSLLFYPIIIRITGPLLRLYDSRATAVSPLSAFGWKDGCLSLRFWSSEEIQPPGNNSLFFPSLIVSLYFAS